MGRRGRPQQRGCKRAWWRGYNQNRLSAGWIDLPARYPAAGVPLAGQRGTFPLLADRNLIRRSCVDGLWSFPRRAPPHWQNRSGLRRQHQRTAHADARNSGGACLEAGRGDVADHPAAFGRKCCDGDRPRLSWQRRRPAGVARQHHHPHLEGCGGRADLLSRRAADALGAGERRDQTAGRAGPAAGRLESSQRRRIEQPRGDGEPAGVRQLPFVFGGRQDDGNGFGRATGQSRNVLSGAGGARDGGPQDRRDSVELARGQAEGEHPDRLHVAGFAGRAVRGDHGQPGGDVGIHRSASEQLLCGQFQGLPVPPGILSDARDSELVQPRDGSAAAAPRRRRSAIRADGRRLESRRPVSGIRACRGHRPQSTGCAAG